MRSRMESLLTQPRKESRALSRFAGKRVHFIGIGGSGMSGLARMLLDDGAIVTGSEPNQNSQTAELIERGVKVSTAQTGELLDSDIDLVVRTAAVPENNREYQASQSLRTPHMKYAELLGEVMAERFGIAVAGTHGKSTTSAMISYALLRCKADPSFVIGGSVPQLGGGSRSGASRFFVAEACEYDRSFHNLHPRVAIITNIEEDHLDCYKNIEEIVESFKTFAQLTPHDGLIIANGNDSNVTTALKDVSREIQTVAIDHDAEWMTKSLGVANGSHRGEVFFRGTRVCTIHPRLPGEHNLFNSTIALAACAACGIDPAQAASALSEFTGVDRRMSEIGRCNGAIVVDDYGHHPTEIRATLAALREKYSPKRLICVFQPHQHSRTRFLLEDFATSFVSADETIAADIYFVRDSESERQRVTSEDLVRRIKRNGQNAQHIATFADIVQYLRKSAREGDLIVTMGAGNVCEISKMLVEKTNH